MYVFSNNSNEPSQGVGLCTGDYDKTCFGKSGESISTPQVTEFIVVIHI